MKKRRRSVFCILIVITLLFLFVCMCACNEEDFYEQYGDPIVSELLGGADLPSGDRTEEQGSVDTSSGSENAVATSDDADTTSDESVKDEGGSTEETTTEDVPSAEKPPVNDEGQSTSTEEPPADSGGTTTVEDSTPEEETTTVEDPAGDEQTTVIEEPTTGEGTPPTEETNVQSGETDVDEELSEEQEIDYGKIFDLTVESGGLYRYIFGEGSKAYPVYVGMREIGKAAFVAGGTIRFDCGFEQEEREVWGTWDENDNLILFVRFEELSNPFRKIVLRSSLAEALQIDLAEKDLKILKKHEEQSTDQDTDLDQEAEEAPKDETVDPVAPQNEQTTEENDAPDEGGETSSNNDEENDTTLPTDLDTPNGSDPLGDSDTPSDLDTPVDPGTQNAPDTPSDPAPQNEPDPPVDPGPSNESETTPESVDPLDPDTSSDPDVQGGTDGTDEELGETLPAESAVAFLWEGVGTAKDVEIIVLSEEEEEYSFLLSGSGEQRALLLDRLSPYITYRDESASGKLYQAEIPLDPIRFNVYVQIVGDGDLFAAQVNVVG